MLFEQLIEILLWKSLQKTTGHLGLLPSTNMWGPQHSLNKQYLLMVQRSQELSKRKPIR